jgi:hypothetical protein
VFVERTGGAVIHEGGSVIGIIIAGSEAPSNRRA